MASLKYSNQKNVWVQIEYIESIPLEELETLATILEGYAKSVRREIERQSASQPQGAEELITRENGNS
jgi:hypothetical protein